MEFKNGSGDDNVLSSLDLSVFVLLYKTKLHSFKNPSFQYMQQH